MDLSQFMKELKQHVAVEVNKLEGGSGAFWSGRYKSKPIDDPAGHQLVRSMVYVDLNPLAAGLCETPEQGRHTSLEARLEREQPAREAAGEGASFPATEACSRRRRRILVPMARDARSACGDGSATATAAGRVVFGGLTLRRYLRVVDAVARLLRAGKASLDRRLGLILERVGLGEEGLRAGFTRMAGGSPHF